MLKPQTLNYRIYIKNIELTEDQIIKTNILAEEIRNN
jgi:hypothetical protein